MKTILLLLVCFYVSNVFAQNDDLRKLRHDLFVKRRYDKDSRPVRNYNTSTNLTTGLSIIKFSDLDSKSHVLTTEVWVGMNWTDEYMTWDPKSYGGLKEIRLNSNDIWKPDLTVYNSAQGTFGQTVYADTHAIAYSDGTILWIPSATFKSFCPMDLTNYPFDTQVCNITMGSWTHNFAQISLISGEKWTDLDMGHLVEGPAWKMIDKSYAIEVKSYPCSPECGLYGSVTYTFTLKRRSASYDFTLVLPTIAAVILILSIFWLPTRWLISRILLAVVSILILTPALNQMTNELGGAGATIPYSVQSSTTIIFMASVSVLLSVLVYYVTIKSHSQSLPVIVSGLMNGILGIICCLHSNQQKSEFDSELPSKDVQANYKTNLLEKEWLLLANFMDRIFFCLCAVTLIVGHV